MIRPLEIEYHRPPDRRRIYRQELLHDVDGVQISYQAAAPLEKPMVVQGRTILEPGSPVVWFTFPGLWHDIGRFHNAAGDFTGLYANVLTPVVLHSERSGPARWSTTDLFLDLWVGIDTPPVILDEAEWSEARAAGHLDAPTADRARREADDLLKATAEGDWPPAVVQQWTLERTLELRRALEASP